MIYKYITTRDLKQLSEKEICKLAEAYDIFIFVSNIEKLKKLIASNKEFSRLYKAALESHKPIILVNSLKEIGEVNKYLKFNKVEAKRILIIK